MIYFSETEVLAKISFYVIGVEVLFNAAINTAIAIALYFFYFKSSKSSGLSISRPIFKSSSLSPNILI